MATVGQWVEGARLRTLPLAVAPVIAGSAAAAQMDSLHVGPAVLALLVAFFLQVGVNYANDYSDGIKGTDDETRVGPLRLTGSGAAAPRQVKLAAFACFGAAGAAGLWLIILAGQWWFLLIGASAVLAAWGYTGGKHPYGYLGLGDLFVFIYFGLVATLGTTFTQASRLSATAWCAAVAMGLIACALLMANNLRDIPTDEVAGKRTMAVRLGDARARLAYAGEIVLAYAVMVFAVPENPWVLLVLCSLVLAVPAVRTVLRAQQMRALIPVLRQTGFLSLAFALLLVVAAVMAA
ncbi:1,4-dihydroxy-2-naphthoate polyprenyltransferase [Rothia kristinae]|uniref:1,4-dihydroxy-2-naphthoate octaprenyltransferase n=2 Tax=Rothia kristinae TaxID=37923 RepID=A0A199NU86_9MICC|nr:1,4-dihydroxy-2-naphthoate polyprenyltransferase [Rothia kristinae]OAX52266.1 1,4-dihydroxy-2-naphthoate polyprenyltransferase [Rothia kristinae]